MSIYSNIDKLDISPWMFLHKWKFLLWNVLPLLESLYNSVVVECFPMARETRIQSQVESYQILRKWYLIPPCLTLSIIKYVSRVKWSNPGKGVAPFPKPWRSSYWKGSFQVALDYGHQLYLYNSVGGFQPSHDWLTQHCCSAIYVSLTPNSQLSKEDNLVVH